MAESLVNLDWKDKKILRELDHNARQSAADIAKKVGLSKQIVAYRLNNLQKNGFIKGFMSFIDVHRMGYSFYDVFFKLKHYSNEEETEIIEKIKNISEVGWFVSTRGEWKFVVCILAKDNWEFSSVLEKIISILGDKLITYKFFIVLDAYQLPYKKVLGASKEEYPKQNYLGTKEELKLSNNDFKILSKLASNSRIQKNTIAEEEGLTLEVVRHSMKKLEKSGLIQAYKPLLDVSKAGYSWHILLIQFNYCSDKIKKEFQNFLKSLPEVFFLVKGVGNWSMMIELHTKTLDEFNVIQDNINAKFEKLIGRKAVIQILKEHKCVFYPVV